MKVFNLTKKSYLHCLKSLFLACAPKIELNFIKIVHHREWLPLKADIFLIKLDPIFTMFYRVLKKLQCFQKVGPAVFGTGACSNLSQNNGYQFVSKGTIDIK